MGHKQVRLAISIIALGLAACGRGGGCLEVMGETELLAAPYPNGYPSSNPKPNRVLRTLPPGRYQYSATETGHDYMVYRLKVDGTSGYVVADDRTRACP